MPSKTQAELTAAEFDAPARRGTPWGAVVRHVYAAFWRDDLFGHAAQLAYYFTFALFPVLLFLASLLAFLPVPDLLDKMLAYFNRVLPPAAMSLVRHTLTEIIREPRGVLLSLSVVATVWAASSGMQALIYSINIAYGIRDTRAWWKDRVLAIGLTLGFVVLIILSQTLLFFGSQIGEKLALVLGLGEVFKTTWNVVQWPLVIGFVLFACDLLYYVAPNGKHCWRWVTPGAAFAVAAWLALSFGLSYYVGRFSNYTLTYGSIGGVMVLMLWLYFTGLAILIGGEINSAIDHCAEEAAMKTPPPAAEATGADRG
jgi:membrane protein